MSSLLWNFMKDWTVAPESLIIYLLQNLHPWILHVTLQSLPLVWVGVYFLGPSMLSLAVRLPLVNEMLMGGWDVSSIFKHTCAIVLLHGCDLLWEENTSVITPLQPGVQMKILGADLILTGSLESSLAQTLQAETSWTTVDLHNYEHENECLLL